ncbi:TIGR04053 family radical SAM/SPASM domain-containing protein [Streptosporangium roseum]|uniref:Radical SAM domain-containing protein n=1 Tax=Streptosporangium roseum (strain ATCC 12428 / DSM 43021 / JCM 3005 / KCTC 9067 / NCIMB 10171 / NRRL 2505 / NI 9100) TaxID=479432 RepID=D2AYE6_STRRD|nr:TIGR04053 family radical SAM/SPASM domain-containing protein [Streptosporangium roseum]ACZ87156.1 radical SAM domain-containing protein [Streptosporangium roseum DSM 43021]
MPIAEPQACPGEPGERTACPVRHVHRDVAAAPFIVIWEATRACPLACLHCRAEARPERDPAELSTAEAVDLMRQITAFGRPAPLFVITGGDPFERPDLYDLVERARELELSPSVSPSATPALTPVALTRLRDAGASVISLSLDGATAGRHDGFRGFDGVFTRTLRSWQAACDTGLKVQINTTVTKTNLMDLPDIARLVRDRGALLWSLFLLIPTGRGRSLTSLTAAETEDVLNFAYDIGAAVPVKATEAHHFRRIAIQRHILQARGADHVQALGLGPVYRALHRRAVRAGLVRATRTRRPPIDVSAGRGLVFVSHNGEVSPSGFLPLPAGNVRDRPLTEIYRTSPVFTSLRDPGLLAGRCGACEFRAVCGGSRSRAYATSGDVLAEEPWCSYVPGGFPYQDELRKYLGAAVGAPGLGHDGGPPPRPIGDGGPLRPGTDGGVNCR